MDKNTGQKTKLPLYAALIGGVTFAILLVCILVLSILVFKKVAGNNNTGTKDGKGKGPVMLSMRSAEAGSVSACTGILDRFGKDSVGNNCLSKTPAAPTCDTVTSTRAPYDKILTWYGVQTDGPLTDGVVTWDMYEKNAQAVLSYMYSSPIQYTGICLHLDPPTAETGGKNAKPANFSTEIDKMVALIAGIDPRYRVGFHAVVEQDAVWTIDTFGSGNPAKTPVGSCSSDPTVYNTCRPDLPSTDPSCAQRCYYNQYVSDFAKGTMPHWVPSACGKTCSDATTPWVPPPGQAGNPAWQLAKPEGWYGPSIKTAWTPSGQADPLNPKYIQWPGGPLPCDHPTASTCPSTTLGPLTAGGAAVTGYPYQTVSQSAASGVNGAGACKASPDMLPNANASAPASYAYPPGCPGNMSRLAWYVAFVNNGLRARNSPQRVSMMNWDAEGNGPTGLQCATFQFLYGIRAFGTADDIQPTYSNVKTGKVAPYPWTLYQNGAAGMTSSMATATPDAVQCGHWAGTPINLNPGWKKPTNPSIATFGDMATFKASPEYYWFDGQDMGGAADGQGSAGTAGNMLPSLANAGYQPCQQSSPGKPGYNAACGCRQTVYDTYSKVDNGGIAFLGIMDSLYSAYASDTTPAFSIEHLGAGNDPDNYGTCINSQNFCSDIDTIPNKCTSNVKCIVRCGVANFFGNWTESCFLQFLTAFMNKHSALDSVMIYDAGFVPPSWITKSPPGTGLPGLPNIACPVDTLSPYSPCSPSTSTCVCPAA